MPETTLPPIPDSTSTLFSTQVHKYSYHLLARMNDVLLFESHSGPNLESVNKDIGTPLTVIARAQEIAQSRTELELAEQRPKKTRSLAGKSSLLGVTGFTHKEAR